MISARGGAFAGLGAITAERRRPEVSTLNAKDGFPMGDPELRATQERL